MNYKQVFARQAANIERIKKLNPDLPDTSGIYIFVRRDEIGINYAYVGQALNIVRRAADHLSGYQHIDLSIKKHGLHDVDKNPHGWRITARVVPPRDLDAMEQAVIKQYADLGYQLRNATTGSQGEGKRSISDRGRGGYLKGKHDGELKALREIGTAIEKYTCGIESKGGAIADRKTAELKEKLRSAESYE